MPRAFSSASRSMAPPMPSLWPKALPGPMSRPTTRPSSFHGTPDEIVPITQRQQFYEALTVAAVEATLIEVEDLGHSIEDTIKTGKVRHDLIDVFDAHLRTVRPETSRARLSGARLVLTAATGDDA